MELKAELFLVEAGGRINFASGVGVGHVGRIKAGTYSDPVLSAAPGETFFEIWAKCTGIGHVYGMRVNVQASNPASNSHNAGRFELDLTAITGIPGGGAAIHAATELGAGPAGVGGMVAGLNASMIIKADTRALAGMFASLMLQSQIGANNTFSTEQPGSFIGLVDADSVKWPYFVDCHLLATGAGNAYVTGAHAGSTVGAVLRCLTPFGVGYVKIYSD